MTPLTRHTHYATIPRSPHARGTTRDARSWTRASALTALALFVQDEGRLPRTKDLRATNGMPTDRTVQRLFNGIDGYRGTYRVPVPQPPPAAPPSSYAKLVECPRCGKRWPSPDSRFERYCSSACREKATHEDGQWINGTVVTLKSSGEFTAWEVRALGL